MRLAGAWGSRPSRAVTVAAAMLVAARLWPCGFRDDAHEARRSSSCWRRVLGQFRRLMRHRLDLGADQALDIARSPHESIAGADGDAFAAGRAVRPIRWT